MRSSRGDGAGQSSPCAGQGGGPGPLFLEGFPLHTLLALTQAFDSASDATHSTKPLHWNLLLKLVLAAMVLRRAQGALVCRSCCSQSGGGAESTGFHEPRFSSHPSRVLRQARAACGAHVCVPVWEAWAEPRGRAERGPGPRDWAPGGELGGGGGLVVQDCLTHPSAPGMGSMNCSTSCTSTTSPCSSSLLASGTSLKRLSVRPTSSTPTSTWCPTTWTSTIM